MPIEALPQETTRLLGSSVVLNDATSVVKELVDNALDARASAINIEISANTLDVIQVKDNGTGIDVRDRQLLFRKGCTSKIRTIEDLVQLGGTFLGFRGEALASVVELSRDVVVTTKVEGEAAGTATKCTAEGAIRWVTRVPARAYRVMTISAPLQLPIPSEPRCACMTSSPRYLSGTRTVSN
jgi:DNA mismatch repair ATPase MutL